MNTMEKYSFYHQIIIDAFFNKCANYYVVGTPLPTVNHLAFIEINFWDSSDIHKCPGAL